MQPVYLYVAEAVLVAEEEQEQVEYIEWVPVEGE